MADAGAAPQAPVPTTVGRDDELTAVERFLGATRGPVALVLRGEAGIGKSTLWRAALARADASGWRVLRTRASELEAEQADAGLRDLLDSIPDELLDELPPVQRTAIDAVLLRGTGPIGPVDARTVSVAALGLLERLAQLRPILVCVDDSQWLDRATADALAFVARRIAGPRVRFLTTRRAGEPGFEDAIDRDERQVLELGPLSVASLFHVIRDRLGESFPRRTLVSINAVARGNPLFVLEIARALSEVGEPPAGDPLPVPTDIRDLVASRLRDLPAATRAAMLRLALSSDMAPRLEDLDAAIRADVVMRGRGGTVDFVHPLFASAIHDLASAEERREAHAELAVAEAGPERRARHLALSMEGPDEAVAAALSEASTAARVRGSPETAIELAQLALERTPPGDHEAADRRRLALARHVSAAGDPGVGIALAQAVAASPATRELRVDAYVVLTGIAEVTDGLEAAMAYSDLALEAAGDDPGLRAPILAHLSRAFDANIPRKVELARAALAAAEAAGATGWVLAESLIAVAEAQVFAGEGFDGGPLDRAEAIETSIGRTIPESRDSFYIRAWLEVHTEQLDAAERHFRALAEYTEAAGLDLRSSRCHIALTVLAIRRGDLDEADRHVGLVDEIDARMGRSVDWGLIGRAMIAAHRGDTAAAERLSSAALERSADRVVQRSESHAARGLAAFLAGDASAAAREYDAAAANHAQTGVREPGVRHFEPDWIEALILAGELDRAIAVLRPFEAHGRRFDRPWILATSLRCRALLAASAGRLDEAADLLAQALEQHGRLSMRIAESRTRLALGMVERRRRRYQAARTALLGARALALAAGAGAWVARADTELARTHVRETPTGLTPTERQVAELAAAGVTNREIASRLFISPKTVEANLARAYRKLDISSRAQLGAALSRAPASADTAQT